MSALTNWKAWAVFLAMLVIVRVVERQVPMVAKITNPTFGG